MGFLWWTPKGSLRQDVPKPRSGGRGGGGEGGGGEEEEEEKEEEEQEEEEEEQEEEEEEQEEEEEEQEEEQGAHLPSWSATATIKPFVGAAHMETAPPLGDKVP
ncbi:Hypothetical predicted protein [Marmota monax]|uniref:Uncharacterized protein n=1 Tax=Marmota monax TaxID=9995 RepID=A0A5E4CH33_MARMO|nr:Hypothetical predicted protein [Marmota monax]